MKIKQAFDYKLTEDMHDMLLFAIKEVMPERYKHFKDKYNTGDNIIIRTLWNTQIDEITYNKIIEVCEKYIKMKAFT